MGCRSDAALLTDDVFANTVAPLIAVAVAADHFSASIAMSEIARLS